MSNMATKSLVVEKEPKEIADEIQSDNVVSMEDVKEGKLKHTFDTKYSALHIRVYAEHFGCKEGADNETQIEYLANGLPRLVKGLDGVSYFIDAGLHDMDTDKSDPVNPLPLKPHGHIVVWYRVKRANGKQDMQRMGCLFKRLERLGMRFRIKNADGTKGKDWNHFQSSVKRLDLQRGDLRAMVAYLDHNTYDARQDGKYQYLPLGSNPFRWSNDVELSQSLIEDYHAHCDFLRNSKGVIITSTAELKAYYKDLAYTLGKQGGDYRSWYLSLPSNIQIGGYDKLLAEWYRYGADEYLDSDIGINNTRCVIFINGAKNVGKTYNSALVLREMGYKTLEIEGGKTGKFDNLSSAHGAMVVSDTGLSDYLAVCDDKFTYLYRRNNSNPLWCGKYLVITFNGSLEDYLKRFACDFFFDRDDNNKLVTNDSYDALKSRIYECVCDKNGLRVKDKDSLAYRGMYEKQIERHKMFKEFRDRFNKAQQEYLGSLKADKPSALVELEKDLCKNIPIDNGFIEVTEEMMKDCPFS